MSPSSISVIIPAYNIGAQLSVAVESVLAQSVPVREVFIVDDGSIDNTAEVAERFGPPVRLLRKQNGGPASARNLGAAQATGDWLALLDADDWWFAEKNEIQLRFTESPDIGLVHCLFDHRIERPPAELSFDDLWHHNWIGNSSVMIRRSVFEELGGFNEARSLISVEDYNLWLRVAAAGYRIVTCPHILAHYTQGTGISSNLDRLMRASMFNLDDLQTRLGIPAERVQRKRKQIRAAFGRQALYNREIGTARELLLQTVREEPSVKNAVHLVAANLPLGLLNVKRNLASTGWRRDAKGAEKCGEPTKAVPVDEIPYWSNRRTASILDPQGHIGAESERLPHPLLVTSIDAEEDFDWNAPFDRTSSVVTSMRSQQKAHRVFERYGVKPLYLVDYPVASQDAGRAPLLELLQGGLCEIGAQLHPWVSPPFVETVSMRNSYPGNLPLVVEFGKLSALTDMLEDAFGDRPRIYRAGRCGVGPNTGDILLRLGYEVDTSVMPRWDYRVQCGPNFRALSAKPFWIDKDRTLLEMPIASELVGRAARLSLPSFFDPFGEVTQQLGITSMLSRVGLLERIRLSPEGIHINEAKRLVRQMLSFGHKVFVLTYHSPSLEPGNTPYVRTADDVQRFLDWLEEFYAFFTSEIGGRCVGWRDVRDSLKGPDRSCNAKRSTLSRRQI